MESGEKMNAMTLEEKINVIFNKIGDIDRLRIEFKSMESSLQDFKSSMESSLQDLESRIDKKFRNINRKIESDQRTTQAIGRLVQDAGLSFKGTRIPYPLQGNAAIEDIKDYY